MSPPTNSINGYVAKLQFRLANRTLLVEGESDRTIISALVLRVPPLPGYLPLVIDSADTIKGGGLGNREIVEVVHNAAKAAHIGGCACLVDREFREFTCTAPCSDGLGKHNVIGEEMFWTRGHSVENYLFVAESVIRYLEIAHPSHIPADYKSIVAEGFVPILAQAVAFSLAAYASGVIQKSDRIVTLADWSTSSSGLPMLAIKRVGASLITRAATAASVLQLESEFEAHLRVASSYSQNLLRWIAHGHLGVNVIWTGIGHLFRNHIANSDVVESISRGQNDYKRAVAADLWAARACSITDEEVPGHLMAWMAGQ